MRPELWDIEKGLFSEGYKYIAGVDEAGRGPLVGDVYAAAVILPGGIVIPGLDDSKKLSEKRREQLYNEIVKVAISFSVAFATVAEIEELNILGATMQAMNHAIAGLSVTPDISLIDGNTSKGITCPNRTIVDGDAKSASIAAASILAKVSRDRYMVKLAELYPGYGFEKHKGYGTRAHYAAIDALGVTPVHRLKYLRKYYDGRHK